MKWLRYLQHHIFILVLEYSRVSDFRQEEDFADFEFLKYFPVCDVTVSF